MEDGDDAHRTVKETCWPKARIQFSVCGTKLGVACKCCNHPDADGGMGDSPMPCFPQEDRALLESAALHPFQTCYGVVKVILTAQPPLWCVVDAFTSDFLDHEEL